MNELSVQNRQKCVKKEQQILMYKMIILSTISSIFIQIYDTSIGVQSQQVYLARICLLICTFLQLHDLNSIGELHEWLLMMPVI